MSTNVDGVRNAHRKTFSFLPSSWFASKLPLQPAGHHSTDSVPHEYRLNTASASASAPPAHPASPDDPNDARSPVHSPFASSPRLLPPRQDIHRQSMRLARKVKKFGRDATENAKPKQRPRVGDMLEDPYSLTAMAPSLFVAPSPSPSVTSFLESEHTTSSLRRSATIGNHASGLPVSQPAGVQRARSVAVFPSLALPIQLGERGLSPVVFAPREETSQPPSETSSASYSESLAPSKAPSLIEEQSASEVPSTALSRPHRNISSDSNAGKSHARLASSASSLSKAARVLGSSQDLPHQQEPSGSSSSSQLGPPLIRRRSPSPQRTAILDGDLFANPPQRTLSLRRVQVPRPSRRRLSLDLSSAPIKSAPTRLKKSRSALAASRRPMKPDAVDELVDSYLSEDSGHAEPVDEKQHAINVRRARKMMQLFGDKPPKELFNIRSHRGRDDTIDTISILTTVSENRRESRATFTSVTSSISITRHLRDSVQSSNSDPPSPMLFSAPEGSVESQHDAPEEAISEPGREEESEPEPEREPRVADAETATPAAEQAPSTAEDIPLSPSRRSAHSREGTPGSPRPSGPRPRPSLASLSLGSSGSFSHSRSHSQHSQTALMFELVPPLPTSPLSPNPDAPFSDLLPSRAPAASNSPMDADLDERERERQAATSPPPENFRARRIRAAKLSRFFGVAPHDLTDALTNPPASPTLVSAPPYTNARSGYMGRPRSPREDAFSPIGSVNESSSTPSLLLQSQFEAERSQSHERPSITVEVAADVPRPFRLGRDKKGQELDMDAVLDQLRRMR